MGTTNEMKIGALAAWFGGKRTMTPTIVEEIGPHRSFWEPFCGSMAVLFGKPVSREETVNDLHGDIVGLARVVASDQWWDLCDRVQRTPFCDALFDESKARLAADGGDEVQRAYDYLVVSWMGMNGVAGTRKSNANFCVRYTSNGGDPAKRWRSVGESLPAWHDRLLSVRILRRDAFGLLERIEDKEGTVVYLDPPYISKSHDYLWDFGADVAEQQAKHRHLAAMLTRFKRTRCVLSYYDHPLLAEMYPGWTVRHVEASKGLVSAAMRDGSGTTKAPEVLLMNGPSLAGAPALSPAGAA